MYQMSCERLHVQQRGRPLHGAPAPHFVARRPRSATNAGRGRITSGMSLPTGRGRAACDEQREPCSSGQPTDPDLETSRQKTTL